MNPMLILNTDHMSLLEWGGQESSILRERLATQIESDVYTTIISYEEQIRGWMAYIARARTLPHKVEAYRRLRNHLENYRQIRVLDFDQRAADSFQALTQAKIRVVTMDLKIAAIALTVGGTLLSRNRQDFELVPGLRVEDWSKEDGP
jgi:tRNA(fMet)-specific endonuclease VapC